MTPTVAPILLGVGENGTAFWAATVIPAGGLLAALPLALLTAARFRSPAPRTLDAARRLPLRSFLVGLLAGVAVLLLVAATAASPFFGVAALLVLSTAGVLGFLGLVVEARALGCELRGRDPASDGAEGGSVALGWLVLAGLPLLFGAGILVLLYLFLRSTGASILAMAGEKSGA